MRRSVHRLLTLCLLLAAGASFGCSSSVLPGRSPALGDDVAELKRRVLELQRQAARSEIEIDRLRARIAQLEGGAPPSARSPRTTPPTPPEPIVEDLDDDTPPVGPTDEPVLEEVDLPEEDIPVERPARPAPSEPALRTSRAVEVSEAGQALYDRGYALYHQGRYLDAESTFDRFLSEYGGTELADNARYWIGEARYARGDLEGALESFREAVERDPSGNKVPDALLKAGQVLDDLGDADAAREMYRELLRRFPESDAAAVAERRLRSSQ